MSLPENAMAQFGIIGHKGRMGHALFKAVSDAGHEVWSAGSGNEALERCKDGPPDLVLLDLKRTGIRVELAFHVAAQIKITTMGNAFQFAIFAGW